MTDDEIIKALECCATASAVKCNDCPYVNKPSKKYCVFSMAENALDLITRLKEENKALHKALAEKSVEVVKLTTLCQEQNNEIKRQIAIKTRLLYNLKEENKQDD